MAEQGSDSGDLTATLKGGSDIVYDLYCEVCADFNKHLEAKGFCINCSDYLCEDCVKAHGTHRASRNHVVQSKSQMPRKKPPPPISQSTTGSISDQCDQHQGRLTEYYCKDDGSLGCTVCMTVKHRQCRSVDHVADISEHLLDSEEYHQFTASLTTLKARSQDVIKTAKDKTSQAEKLCTDVDTALQELRRKVNQAFDKLDNDIKKKTATIKSADVKKMKYIGDTGKEVLSEVEKISAELQTLRNKKQLGQLFVRMIKLEDRVHALHNVLDEADADNSVTMYIVEPGTAAQEFLDNPDAIGKLSVQASVPTPHTSTSMSPASRKTSSRKKPANQRMFERQVTVKPVPPSVVTRSAHPSAVKDVNVSKLIVKMASDAGECDITGSALLYGNKLILADYNNNKIKLLNLQTSTVTSELKTSDKPWDIASITDDQVAITHICAQKIAFLKVTSVLKLDREMQVSGSCTGIVHTNGKLYVAFTKPVKIEIMDINGSVERKIDCSNIFASPSHMTIRPGHDAIYVTDDAYTCVKRVNMDGVVTAEYRDDRLIMPRKVIVDPQGSVFVCGVNSDNIHLLTADLRKVKLLVDGLRSPQSLSLCNSSGKLYVGAMNNVVSVYQLQ